MKTLLVLAGALALAGCGTTAATEVRIETVNVPVRAPCPARAEYDKLKRSRPVPLRSQPMPETAEERVARTLAQLGRFEAEGGWADRAEAALDRCQEEGLAPTR